MVEECHDQGEEGLNEDAASNSEMPEYPEKWLTFSQDEKLGSVKATMAGTIEDGFGG